jgi:hypothetical protein
MPGADILNGYLAPSGFVTGSGRAATLELLDLDGRVQPIPLREVKMVSFVRDFNLADRLNPERILRRTFLARPRAEGLQIRITFHDGDTLEGLAAPDLSLLETAIDDAGIHFAPPDTRANTQRIYVPRSAIASFIILAVIGPSRARKAAAAAAAAEQDDLFSSLPPNSRIN